MVDRSHFLRGAHIYPQPVAVGCGRVARARSAQEELDAALRCGEIVTRYGAAVGISSAAHRAADAVIDPTTLQELRGPLAFGKFLSALQWAVSLQVAHPAARAFSKVAGQTAPSWDAPLVRLLELRNTLGHDLLNISEAHAVATLREEAPLDRLAAALDALGPILELPLFVVEGQELERRKLRARRLLLMGESQDPSPEEVELEGGVSEKRVPYVAAGAEVVPLAPLVVWDVAQAAASYALFLIDRVDDGGLRFQALGRDARVSAGEELRLASRVISGERLDSAETCTLAGGRDLREEWLRRRRDIEDRLGEYARPVSWRELDAPTLLWYAGRLDSSASESQASAVVTDRVLEGRDSLPPQEMRQFQLLFGTPQTVRTLLGRVTLDCRAKKSADVKWDERVEVEHNALQALRAAIEFFSRHFGMAGVSVDGLNALAGSADYIAMREALVNVFIHQDYLVRSAAAQLEIQKDRAVFFNPGRSLVSDKALAEGGRSVARNPLIARALRLIGFAELAGSGLREMSRVWRVARRRPPMFESNTNANTFTLTLDWRPVIEQPDEFWLQALGARVSPGEAWILSLCAEPPGLSAPEIAAATDTPVEDVESAVQRLKVNALLEKSHGRFQLPERHRTLLAARVERSRRP